MRCPFGSVVGLQLASTTKRLSALVCGGRPPPGGQYVEMLAYSEEEAAQGRRTFRRVNTRTLPRYPLSYRDLEEIMTERGLAVDHSTIARWVLFHAPILNQRIRREMRHSNRSWPVDETYVRVASK
jgi:hypothetical protein